MGGVIRGPSAPSRFRRNLWPGRARVALLRGSIAVLWACWCWQEHVLQGLWDCCVLGEGLRSWLLNVWGGLSASWILKRHQTLYLV